MRARERGDVEHVALERAPLDAVAEQPAQVRPRCPTAAAAGAPGGRRRGERAHRAEQRAEHALGRPAQQAERAARPAHADQLVGRGWWCGANITPIEDMTTSKDSSSNGRCSASASTQSSSTPAPSARCRPACSSSGVRSLAVTCAPRCGGRDRGVAGAGGDVEHAARRRRSGTPRRAAGRAGAGTSRPSTGSRRTPTSRGGGPSGPRRAMASATGCRLPSRASLKSWSGDRTGPAPPRTSGGPPHLGRAGRPRARGFRLRDRGLGRRLMRLRAAVEELAELGEQQEGDRAEQADAPLRARQRHRVEDPLQRRRAP